MLLIYYIYIYMPRRVKNNNFLDDCDFLFLNDAFSINKKSFLKNILKIYLFHYII